ncbi:hypothetical protein [Mesorhizobium sp. WSM1293]|uniref:hypothetical protein n=1 Tax=Mesorhizobium sp. WSM1293 TaxID=1040984 RepID=UPI0004822002|nr:hypothetical protein [Mesorhizobium sp. WSM1293]
MNSKPKEAIFSKRTIFIALGAIGTIYTAFTMAIGAQVVPYFLPSSSEQAENEALKADNRRLQHIVDETRNANARITAENDNLKTRPTYPETGDFHQPTKKDPGSAAPTKRLRSTMGDHSLASFMIARNSDQYMPDSGLTVRYVKHKQNLFTLTFSGRMVQLRIGQQIDIASSNRPYCTVGVTGYNQKLDAVSFVEVCNG